MVHQFHTEIRREDSYDECAARRERARESEQEGEMLKQLNLARSHMFPQHAVFLSLSCSCSNKFSTILSYTHTHRKPAKSFLMIPLAAKTDVALDGSHVPLKYVE